ncbi:MAG TPA: hypothetical protein VJP45_12615 [Candidatus Limnocylindria bacterium]|nr:hypothetical protein [Candidatus Limnocylindria bacterium]
MRDQDRFPRSAVIASILALAALTGCSSKIHPAVTFEFKHGEGPDAPTYRATTSDPEVIAAARAELAKPFDLRGKHINGVVGLGEGDDNEPWNWHFERNNWGLADFSTEVCDGTPTYVAEHVEEWVRDVGRYCPWGSRVVREFG